MKSFSRSPFYMQVVGWGLYAAAGYLLWQNCGFTVAAFRSSSVPLPLAYGATVFIAFVESATAIFLLSPRTWNEVGHEMRDEAVGTLGEMTGVARTISSIVVSILTAALLALVVSTYVIDWRSTIEGLGLSLGNADTYKVLLTAVLVFGPEGATILAFQVLRRSRESQILAYEEDSRLEPARIYAREMARRATDQAKRAAASSNWSPPRSP